MTRLVVLGHGGFNQNSDMVLVPANTTVTFFSDAGSNLMLPSVWTGPGDPAVDKWVEGTNCRFDYERIANVLDQFVQAESPLEAGKVVPNMLLQAAGAETQRVANELNAQGKWGDEILINPGSGTWWLCYGDASTCPTPKLHVASSRNSELVARGDEAVEAFRTWLKDGASGDLPEVIADFASRLADVPPEMYEYVAEGVPDARWSHDCQGILGKDVGEGREIIWLACSGFAVTPETLENLGLPEGLPSEITATTDGPSLDWKPNEAALDRIAKLNGEKVKDTPDGESIAIRVGGALVLIGSNHEGDVENYLSRQDDLAEGTLSVTKGSAFSKGSVEIEGIPTSAQELVKTSIGRFSDKKVKFS